jgi:nucleotide-binding universal stress UspA family protein
MYKKILVAIDGSQTSRRALDVALALAQDNQAALLPVYVASTPIMSYDLVMYDPSAMRAAMIEEGKLVTAEAVKLMAAARIGGTPHVIETEGVEDVAHRILAAADELGADLLVLGTHGRRGVQRLLLGSVAERVVRLSSRPILLVPGTDAEPNPGASATNLKR